MRLRNIEPDGAMPVRLFSLYIRMQLAVLLTFILLLAGKANAQPHRLIPEYCNVLVTYACYAKTIWHDAPEGGYWGDGLDAKNQNGAVRGTCNTLLTYAMLVHAMDADWLRKEDVKALKHANLNRHELIRYIRLNVAYLVAHHKSATTPVAPQWGYHWQSSLWMQSLGMGVLLTWKDLGEELRTGVKLVAAAEAEWVASRPPRSESPGNTGAEENGWDTGAPAVALALIPEATSSTQWMQTLKKYAANTYSHPGDKSKSSVVAEMISTKNINKDWTLFNHNFFHPDYAQVSGMHLGEAWLILGLGDRNNGTTFAQEFEPYSKHNVEEVWKLVLRPLLLPSGEFAYPAGNDWTYHCSTNQGYFAYIATAFDSYDAAEAEARGLQHVKNRREAGPPGRILGDSNLEWWWEPLVCKRSITAILHHEFRPDILPEQPIFEATVDGMTTTVDFVDAKVWLQRTPSYLFSISYGKPRVGFFMPFGGRRETEPYSTIPLKNGLLPTGHWTFKPGINESEAIVSGGIFWRDAAVVGVVVCLDNSVVLLSRDGFGAVGVENDSLTDPGRIVQSSGGQKLFPSLAKSKETWFPGPWINVDEMLGLISLEGFKWKPTGAWNQFSVAVDHVNPRSTRGAWQLLSANAKETEVTADAFIIESTSVGIEAIIQDGPVGRKFQMRLADDGISIKVLTQDALEKK